MSFLDLNETARQYFVPKVLYMMATPIGNLTDLSARAVAGLACADIVCAEDTRIASRLLSACGLSTHLVSVREHNEQAMAKKVCRWLSDNNIVVYLSDAGTPALSDPGARLADAVWRDGFCVSVVPGPCAAVAAWSASGVLAHSFLFQGFLPAKSIQRCIYLERWRTVDYAVICYEAPHRIISLLSDIVKMLSVDRQLILGRELTKAFETIVRMPAGELLAWVRKDTYQQRGEMTLIICPEQHPKTDRAGLTKEADRVLRILLLNLPIKQAVQLSHQITHAPKKLLYRLALTLRDE